MTAMVDNDNDNDEETTRHCLVGPDDDKDNGDGSWGGVLLVMVMGS